MDVDQLRDFVTLAEELHFGRTARRRLTSAQTLSRRVHELERQLGVRLFERTSRRVSLTAAGAKLLERAARVVSEVDSFQAEARDVAAGRTGSLRAMYSAGAGEMMGMLIRRLRVDRPAVDVMLEESTDDHIVATIVSGKADLGIVHAQTGVHGLASLTLGSEPRNVIAMPLGHRLLKKRCVTFKDLEGETIIHADSSLAHLEPTLHPAYDPWHSMGINVVFRYEHVITEAEYLDRVGAGFGVLPIRSSTLRRNQRTDVAFRPLVGPRIEVFDYLVWRTDNVEPLVRAFVEITRALLPLTSGCTENAGG